MKLDSPTTPALPPYTNLAVAIVERACQDYVAARYARLRFPDDPYNCRLSRTEAECLAFFRNQEHPAWMSFKIGPERLINALNKLVETSIKEGRPPKINSSQFMPRRRENDVYDEEIE